MDAGTQAIAARRVGIVLPSGIGAFITNLAIVLLGKIPVNLNFTAGRTANIACIKKSGVDTIITAQAMREKIPDFPWTEQVLDLVEELKSIGKKRIIPWFLAVVILPSKLLAKILRVPRIGDNEEAGLIFSSGSTGDPKGVVLTHRNVISNCEQISDCKLLDSSQKVMATLPVFHSFGFTVLLWYPIIHGVPVVCLPSPLEVKRIASVIRSEKTTVFISTPTFLRPFFKKATKQDLASIRFVVTGAEKTPAGFKERWERHFGNIYLEGYGLTETSPVTSVNLPDEDKLDLPSSMQSGIREGSAGRLFPGMSARLVDVNTLEPVSPFSTGILQLRGPNVFNGYLDAPELNAKVIQDGWFTTGDLARFDKDGFLYIEGRLSRFSKIGGEMVPHGTVEQHVAEAFGIADSERPLVAVSGVEDDNKGESLVLFSAVDMNRELLRERLLGLGIPNLWIPKRIKMVEEIPCLATGKLDLRALDRMAQDLFDF